MIVPLPPELLDETVAHLHDDITSLKSCSTACHALLPVASRYLLSIITFTHSLKIPPNAILFRFKHALQHSARLRANIREVHLAPTLFARRMISRSQGPSSEGFSVDLRLLSDTLSHLEHLRSVVVKYCRIEPLQGGQPMGLLPQVHLDNIMLGTLYHTSRGTPSYLADTLSLFSNIQINRLKILGQWDGFSTDTAASHTPLRVACLIFHERTVEATPICLNVLCRCLSPQFLTALHISLCAADSLPGVDALIARIGAHLRELRLDLVGVLSWDAGMYSYIAFRITF